MIDTPKIDEPQAYLVRLGTALPRQAVAQDDALSISSNILCENDKHRRMLRMLYRKSEVASRRTVIPCEEGFWKRGQGDGVRGPGTGERIQLYQRYAPVLAMESGRCALGLGRDQVQNVAVDRLSDDDELKSAEGVESDAFGPNEDMAIDPSDVTHLVTVSCTGFAAPGFDWDLFDGLGLSSTVQRVQVGFMGCHGALNGLRVAHGLAASDPDAVVLMSAVELCSLHYRMNWENEAMVGNTLFADGSASAVICGRRAAERFGQTLGIRGTGSVRIPQSHDQMTWTIGDFGFDMVLTGQVPTSIENHLGPWMRRWLGDHGLSMEDIGGWVVHPGGPRILDATEAALNLPGEIADTSRVILERFGNMSSPTVLFVLQEKLRVGAGGPYVMLAFGPGLVAEAVLIG